MDLVLLRRRGWGSVGVDDCVAGAESSLVMDVVGVADSVEGRGACGSSLSICRRDMVAAEQDEGNGEGRRGTRGKTEGEDCYVFLRV